MRVTTEAAKPTTTDRSGYTIEVIDKAVDLLNIFTHEHPSLTLKEIAERADLPKTTVFRILSTLVTRSLCELDERTGEYSLGFAFLHLAEIRRRQTNVHDAALPIMRELRNAVNETIVLSIRTGDYRIHIDSVESNQPMRRIAELGVQAPLYAGAASKVLLAGLPANDLDDYLARTKLVAFQATTITDKTRLRKELAEIAERGYGESRGELFAGGGGLAAPVRDYTRRTVAVIDILTPEHRFTAEHREGCLSMLLDGALQISERLGYRRAETDVPAGRNARKVARSSR